MTSVTRSTPLLSQTILANIAPEGEKDANISFNFFETPRTKMTDKQSNDIPNNDDNIVPCHLNFWPEQRNFNQSQIIGHFFKGAKKVKKTLFKECLKKMIIAHFSIVDCRPRSFLGPSPGEDKCPRTLKYIKLFSIFGQIYSNWKTIRLRS